MLQLDTFLLSISILIIVSILIAKVTNNFGVPILLLFIGVGMFAGSEGPGGIYFDDAQIAQTIGIIALIFILFSGGLGTGWKEVRPVVRSAISLATIGVLVTTVAVGYFVHYLLAVPLLQSFLLGAIVASTDASAVFSILSTRNLNLKGHVKPLLELESGSNDPMAVFLTIGLIQLITLQEVSYTMLLLHFVMEMFLGLAFGLGLGRGFVWLINKLKFPIEGFYTVFTLAFAVLVYSFTASLNGSGFLAVYVAGMVLKNSQIVHKKNIFRFFDGIAWLSQIGMFLTLGLLVFPSQLIKGLHTEIAISLFLILIARPLGVFISLAFSTFNWREKLLFSWVGLRGAVPIILATFPMIAGIPEAGWIFNIVFFIVLTSALLQGWPIPFVAKLLKLDSPYEKKIKSPIEFSGYEDSDMKLINLTVSEHHPELVRKPLVEIPVLKGSLIVTILRNERYFVPSGGTILEPGDSIQVLTDKEKTTELKKYFS